MFQSAVEGYRWHATRCSGSISLKTGSTCRQISMTIGQRDANRQPVAKLSDSPGKLLCDDETFLAYLRQVFHVPA